MRVLVTGASGLIGSALVASLGADRHEVVRLVRRTPRGPDEILWDPASGRIDPPALEGFDAVVHLAGESIASGRWTRERQARIWDSRVAGTRLLCEALSRLARFPGVLVSASAIGYYGDRGDECLDEASVPGTGFLADLTREWEAASSSAEERGIRVVRLRTAPVLSRHGGMLAELLPLFRLGLGGPIADGRAWWSWIAIDDMVRIYRFAIDREDLRGPFNATAPAPVRNAEFARTLGSVLRRPAWLPVPPLALRLRFGKLADEGLLSSARVVPTRLREAGYAFRLPVLDGALRHVLSGSG